MPAMEAHLKDVPGFMGEGESFKPAFDALKTLSLQELRDIYLGSFPPSPQTPDPDP